MLIKKNQEIELKISDLAFGGLGIAKKKDFIFFVRNSIPNQVVLAKINKIKKSYVEGYNVNTIKKSIYEEDAKCEHFKYCGGCTFQQLLYKKQLFYKQKQIYDIFERIGNIKSPNINNIIGCRKIFNYRNKMEFTFSNRPWFIDDESYNNLVLGLHVPKRYNKILDINNCEIQDDIFNKILNIVKKESIINKIEPYDIVKHKGFLRYLVLRKGIRTNEVMINFVTSRKESKTLKPIINKLLSKINNITSIINTINSQKSGTSKGNYNILYGNAFINEKIGNYIYKISPDSFFQTNSYQIKNLYEYIKKTANLNKNDIVYDLYSGTGTIGLYLSNFAKHIYGFEIIENAVKDAIYNAKYNKIKNTTFFLGDLNNIFHSNNNKIKKIPKPNVVIIDPPRPGLHMNTIKDIINQSPKKIIYVSCNPSTQARDIKIFNNNHYNLIDIQPIDMFPHTPHIECIATLTNN